jgi:hypothetical protein
MRLKAPGACFWRKSAWFPLPLSRRLSGQTRFFILAAVLPDFLKLAFSFPWGFDIPRGRANFRAVDLLSKRLDKKCRDAS